MLVKLMEFDHVFRRFDNNFFFKLVGLIVSTVQRINKKRGTRTPLFSDQSVKITFTLFKCPRSIDNPTGFIFLSCRKKIHDNKEFSRENSKP